MLAGPGPPGGPEKELVPHLPPRFWWLLAFLGFIVLSAPSLPPMSPCFLLSARLIRDDRAKLGNVTFTATIMRHILHGNNYAPHPPAFHNPSVFPKHWGLTRLNYRWFCPQTCVGHPWRFPQMQTTGRHFRWWSHRNEILVHLCLPSCLFLHRPPFLSHTPPTIFFLSFLIPISHRIHKLPLHTSVLSHSGANLVWLELAGKEVAEL